MVRGDKEKSQTGRGEKVEKNRARGIASQFPTTIKGRGVAGSG